MKAVTKAQFLRTNVPSITTNDRIDPSNITVTGNMPTEFGMHISRPAASDRISPHA